MMNKKGMTLVELLVYIVLAGMLLAPVIMLVQNSSVNMARDASNANLRMSGREILNIIYDDLRNTGFKLNPSTFQGDTAVSYINPKFSNKAAQCNSAPANTPGCPPNRDSIRVYDVSSFWPYNTSDRHDSLTVRMGRLNGTGVWRDSIDSITYKLENRNLLRRIKGKSNSNGKTITLARNVEALRFLYSEDLVDWDGTFNLNDPNDIEAKNLVQYIKVIIVTKDDKKLSPTKTASIALAPGDTIKKSDGMLYERHEIVIPVPNNGLFP